jgi:hypothetical protein
VRSNLVAIRLPFVGSAASLEDRREPVHVEELVANLAVERFDACVLRRFAGRACGLDRSQLSSGEGPRVGIVDEESWGI